MAGYARHPNFFAAQVVGLGCEANQINACSRTQSLQAPATRCSAFTIQEKGGTRKTVRERHRAHQGDAARGEQGEARAGAGERISRSACSAAAPTAIRASAPIRRWAPRSICWCSHGGTAILSETPEIYGAEHLLTRRAVTQEVGEKLIERIHWWEDYTARNEQRDEQQPLAGQQGGRAHHHPREIARRGGEGRHHQPRRRLRVRRSR